jgi:hypothetical protein
MMDFHKASHLSIEFGSFIKIYIYFCYVNIFFARRSGNAGPGRFIGSCWSNQIGGVPSAIAAAYTCAKKIR